MRLSVIIPGLVLIACGALAGYVWMGMPVDAAKAPPSGMDILRGYKCRKGETKTIVVRGAEDNHSPAGIEPNFIRPGRRNPDVQSYFAGGSYDQVQADKRMTDSFPAPANTAHGLFLIKLKPVANNETDTFSIGELASTTSTKGERGRFGGSLPALASNAGWTKDGELLFAALGDIPIRRQNQDGKLMEDGTLLDFIRAGVSEGWVDFMVQDDTSVDFAGATLCLEPPRDRGVTMAAFAGPDMPMKGVVAISCGHNGEQQPMCDPYVGDTQCSTALPVACIRPDGLPVPRALAKHFAGPAWSGGRLAFTEPLAASRFASYRDVDAICAARFGKAWRTARWHDGPANLAISGYSDVAAPSSRVWIDLVGSPYGTCWSR